MANLKDLIVNGSARVLGDLYANASSSSSVKTAQGTFMTAWVGTKAQYTTAIGNGTITSTTLCIVTDE